MTIRTIQSALILAGSLISGTVLADWYPVTVDRWDPPFNEERQRERVSYTPLESAARRWNVCVCIPHLKDDYWLGANFGLVDEAERLGINLDIYSAGGYDNLDEQRAQLRACLDRPPEQLDGIILSAVGSTSLNDEVREARERGIPVLDMINHIDSPDITARVAVDYYDLGTAAGLYLKELVGDSEVEQGVAWFPGPIGPGWSAAADAGFRAAIEGSPITIRAAKQGDTGRKIQAELIGEVLDELGDAAPEQIDFIVGNGVAAGVAMGVLRRQQLDDQIDILAYYYGPAVHKGIKRGAILASPSDVPVLQARIAVDTLVRILEDQPYLEHAAPLVQVVDKSNVMQWDSGSTLAPRGFRPVFSVKE